MAWVVIPSKGGGVGQNVMSDKEVSVVTTKVKNATLWRINVLRSVFPAGTRNVIMKIDEENGLIGFFETDIKSEEQLFIAKKFGSYGKTSKTVYISGPKVMEKMGFKPKGTRYKIIKMKDRPKDMYFCIDAKRLYIDETPKKSTE